MDIKELESFRLADAVKFHKELNPKLWMGDDLDPAVYAKLMEIAEDFITELGIGKLRVEDITVSGSNAAYSYTPHSDIDLHILVDMDKLPNDEVYRELFTSKKNEYNKTHDIKIRGVPVELYVQDSEQPHHSLGEYSLLKKAWTKIPVKRKANFDQDRTRAKYEKLGELIELALKSQNIKDVERVLDIVKRYRKAGLDKTGEFGPENLAFKALRKQGLIQKLWDLKGLLHSKQLSLANEMGEDYDPNGPPPGPEFKPTMPKGTIRVDVSDVYDWYKLGQHISNMKGLGKHDFGQGPPSTILSFGDEDLEHQYIDALKKTGLDTTDIDPKAHDMKKGQKVDPTYNVNETFDRPYKLKWEKGDHGDVDAYAKMDDGNYLSIMFNKGYNQDNEEAWSVEFYRNNSQEVTGEGDAQRVFATVLGAIQTFIKKYKPNRVIFSASKEVEQGQKSQSRARLYDSLVQRYARAWGFKAFRADTGNKVIYELDRIKPVKEDFNDGVSFRKNLLSILQKNYPNAEFKMSSDRVSSVDGKLTVIGDEADEDGYVGVWLWDANTGPYKGSLLPAIKQTTEQLLALNPGKKPALWADGDNENPEAWNYIAKKLGYKLITDEDEFDDEDDLYEQGVAEMDKSAPQPGRDGKVSHSTYGSRDKKGSDYFKGKEAPGKPITAKQAAKDALDILKKQGVAEGRTAKALIYQTEVYGAKGYYAQCKEPGCDHKTRTYDRPQQAQNAIKKHHQEHFRSHNNQGVAEGRRSRDNYEQKYFDLPTLIDAWMNDLNRYFRNQVAYNYGDDEDTLVAKVRGQIVSVFDKKTKKSKMMIESASGYIPSEKEKDDPRFKTALTVDIKPDTMKRDAKKFGNKISRAGIPPQLNTNGKL